MGEGPGRRVRVTVVGSGLISRAVEEAVGRAAEVATSAAVTAGDLRRCAALVVATDGADISCYPAVMSAASEAGTPWLPVRVELGSVIIGPMAVPGEPGCVGCAASRRYAANLKARLLRDAWASVASFADRLRRPDPWLTSSAACLAAALAADEVRSLITGGGLCRTRGAAVHLRLDTLATSMHRFIPVASCQWCGHMPDDCSQAADIRLTEPRPKRGERTYRLRDLAGVAEDLAARYVDEEYGLVTSLDDDVVPWYPCVSAPSTTPRTGAGGYGRELSYPAARATGIAEAVERLGGQRPCGRRTVVRGCFRELAADALDPATVGIYPDDRYALPGFPFQRYHDHLEISWVWGYSFARSAPLLVPESLAYHAVSARAPERRPFAYETSNGCAVGGCLEEAILHGILELAERDAFLLTWYGRLSLRQLDVGSAADRRLPLLAEGLEQASGMRIHVFDTTMEHGIASVWAMAVRPDDDEEKVKALCTGGSGFDPERAIASALLELVSMTAWQPRRYSAGHEHAARLVDEPTQVRTVWDHILLYNHPRAFPHFDFLFGATEHHPISESFAATFQPHNNDLRADLADTVGRYLRNGLDVIVVDQTGPEHRAGGFVCTKVIIPGLLPMTFGHDNRRVDGLPRLHHVPHQLGYTDHRLGHEDINPYPHPFP